VDELDELGFLADRRTQQAVILNIVVLGEAATKPANDHPAFIALHQDVPWHSMRGMRNRMAHGYFGVDLAIVWQTVVLAFARPALGRDSRCDAKR
jgi:uncharacterized protein with HEPN domain